MSRSSKNGYSFSIKFKPLTINQEKYIDAIVNNAITFCSSVSGSGKTICALAVGVDLFLQGKVDRIILTRPLVEVDETVGHLPGTLEEKTDPFAFIFYDLLSKFFTAKEIKDFKQKNIIKFVPLGMMRGLTMEKSFVLADEMQSATLPQLKLLLTRIGAESKFVIVGDPDQSDRQLPVNYFVHCMERLTGIRDIAIVKLEIVDIVRHPLIPTILERLG